MKLNKNKINIFTRFFYRFKNQMKFKFISFMFFSPLFIEVTESDMVQEIFPV